MHDRKPDTGKQPGESMLVAQTVADTPRTTSWRGNTNQRAGPVGVTGQSTCADCPGRSLAVDLDVDADVLQYVLKLVEVFLDFLYEVVEHPVDLPSGDVSVPRRREAGITYYLRKAPSTSLSYTWLAGVPAENGRAGDHVPRSCAPLCTMSLFGRIGELKAHIMTPRSLLAKEWAYAASRAHPETLDGLGDLGATPLARRCDRCASM